MKKWIEKTYYSSPVFLQNLAVSMYGYKLKRERYGQSGDNTLKKLLETQSYTREQMHEYQEKEFVRLAKHAIKNTEFYKDWASREKVACNDINSLEDLQLFPVIEKETIKSNPSLFKSKTHKKTVTLHTSGTSGTPLEVYTDVESRSNHYAFFSRLRLWYGLSPIDKRATLFGRVVVPVEQKEPPFWRLDFSQKNLLMSSYHLSPNNIKSYYEKLVSYQPEEVISYPSSLVQIAKYIVNNNLDPVDAKLIITTAEMLLPYQRDLIGRAFSGHLVNQYGCTEMAFFAASQGEHLYLHPEHGISEVINEGGELCYSGQGQFVSTGLINYAMPIIRYKVGDYLTLGKSNINGFPEIENLHGRNDDYILLKDGTPIGRLDPVFKGGSGIAEAQIEQLEDYRIILRIVPGHDYSDEKGKNLVEELRKRVGEGLPIDLNLTQNIEKQKNGKFKQVINNIGKGSRNYE